MLALEHRGMGSTPTTLCTPPPCGPYSLSSTSPLRRDGQRHSGHQPAPAHSASGSLSPTVHCPKSHRFGCPWVRRTWFQTEPRGYWNQGFCALIPPQTPQGPAQARTRVPVNLVIGQLASGSTSQAPACKQFGFQKVCWGVSCSQLRSYQYFPAESKPSVVMGPSGSTTEASIII